METEAEETAAIDALDGAEWTNRNLINKAKPREDRGARPGGSWGGGNGRFSRERYQAKKGRL